MRSSSTKRVRSVKAAEVVVGAAAMVAGTVAGVVADAVATVVAVAAGVVDAAVTAATGSLFAYINQSI